jgi:cyclophilin family peptidyl-prolyl cis-trans isomerase
VRRGLVLLPLAGALVFMFLLGAPLLSRVTNKAPSAKLSPLAVPCKRVPRPAPKPDGGHKPPKRRLDPRKLYGVTLSTNCGSFTIRLNVRVSPRTTASFYALARSGYFDRTRFHRIVPGFVIQGGDPTGKGSGGPGYRTVDQPPATTAYRKYDVAMAKTATEPPGTAGSQFFVVTAAHVPLPPDYAVLGTVYRGRKVVDRISKLGDPATEMPTQTIVIQKATARAT